ncbi:hypothetical protein IW261DRAFT_1612189 [Armillaria novae-zelandiae]|uniref:Uncharacterized protein n=1 Tax=Armillaria novae-zelandiae TaxID=153914 RepID=A0AA39NTK1_9AGAR|nr:hypothetical protein IW261DRAFT_1612189 [Armillaria novae-zelandiae]
MSLAGVVSLSDGVCLLGGRTAQLTWVSILVARNILRTASTLPRPSMATHFLPIAARLAAPTNDDIPWPTSRTLAAVITATGPPGDITICKIATAVLQAPSLPIPILPTSSCDEDFSSASSASGMMYPPLRLYSPINYIVAFFVVVVVFVPSTTSHEITPFLAFDGDYAHFPPLSTVATIPTTIGPSTATTGTIITVLLLFATVSTHCARPFATYMDSQFFYSPRTSPMVSSALFLHRVSLKAIHLVIATLVITR